MNQASRKTQDMVKLALFSGIIVVLSLTPLGYIPLGVIKATTIHIPVILGSILLGWKSGAVLGGLFGLTSFMVNTITPNLTSFVFTPFYSLGDAHGNFWSLVICFVPRILVGVVPYFVYQGIRKLSKGFYCTWNCRIYRFDGQYHSGYEPDLHLFWRKLGQRKGRCSGHDL